MSSPLTARTPSSPLDDVFPTDAEKVIFLAELQAETSTAEPVDDWTRVRGAWMLLADPCYDLMSPDDAVDVLIAIGRQHPDNATAELAARLMRMHVVLAWRDARRVGGRNAWLLDDFDDVPIREAARLDLIAVASAPMTGAGRLNYIAWMSAVYSGITARVIGDRRLADAGNLDGLTAAEQKVLARWPRHQRSVYAADISAIHQALDVAVWSIARTRDNAVRDLFAALHWDEMTAAATRTAAPRCESFT